jgi:hypothetical protein
VGDREVEDGRLTVRRWARGVVEVWSRIGCAHAPVMCGERMHRHNGLRRRQCSSIRL